jgi:2-keto-4-pentenoate hydratase/2-oxohepta-3-ene-1,7-dioic acid hydratase in catechol pathway
MRIVTFINEEAGITKGVPRVGALLDDTEFILDFTSALRGAGKSLDETDARGGQANLLAWFDLDGAGFKRALEVYNQLARKELSLEKALQENLLSKRATVRLLAPVPRPGKLIAIGLNYRDHAAESKMPIPERPVVFSKFTTSVIGPDELVVLPQTSDEVDYEAELGVVIGRRTKNVSREDALSYVLGYTNINDVSARDFQFADGQWQRGKSCDTFAPMGEAIVTTDEVPDPHKLSIKLRLNGKTMQDSNTDQLIFGVPELVAFLSETITLEPGDVIATGTPSGVGFARKPPVYIKDGDVMEVEIEKLGTLRNPVSAAREAVKSAA